MKPYYDHAGITIFHADCREIMPTLSKSDLLLTDPPYGIADIWPANRGAGGGWAKAKAQTPARNEWDGSPPSAETLQQCVDACGKAIIWGGNYFALPPSRAWLVWNKPERGFSLAEAELAWTNLDMPVRVWDCRRSDPDREHPTQKPLSLMLWCIQKHKGALTILDPFMGSGTTLLAAKQSGKRAIGIEISEEWCELAAKRMSQECFDWSDNSQDCKA